MEEAIRVSHFGSEPATEESGVLGFVELGCCREPPGWLKVANAAGIAEARPGHVEISELLLGVGD